MGLGDLSLYTLLMPLDNCTKDIENIENTATWDDYAHKNGSIFGKLSNGFLLPSQDSEVTVSC